VSRRKHQRPAAGKRPAGLPIAPVIRMPRFGRRTRALFLAAFGVILFAIGLYGGDLAATRLTEGSPSDVPSVGLYQIAPAVGGTVIPPEDASPRFLYRSDGQVIGPTQDGTYRLAIIPREISKIANGLVRQGRNTWADTYVLDKRVAGDRLEMRIAGDHPRTITIDNALNNPNLPEDLYRFLAIMLRPTGAPPSVAIAPPSVRFHLIAPGDLDGVPAQYLPPGLDLALVQSASGQSLATDSKALADLLVVFPNAASYAYPGNSIPIQTASGAIRRLVWTADWSAFLAGN
jgi:hypothetical protein